MIRNLVPIPAPPSPVIQRLRDERERELAAEFDGRDDAHKVRIARLRVIGRACLVVLWALAALVWGLE